MLVWHTLQHCSAHIITHCWTPQVGQFGHPRQHWMINCDVMLDQQCSSIWPQPEGYFPPGGIFFFSPIKIASKTTQQIKVIGIRPLAPVQNSASLKLMQRKTFNFVINLLDVENLTKWLDSILTKVSIIKTFYTLEFILSVQLQICSILNIVRLREN